MAKIKESGDFLTLDELHPTVDLAAYYEFKEKQWYKYRVPGAHFLLIKSGEIEAIALSGSRGDQLGRALGPTIETAMRESIRRDPQEMASAIFQIGSELYRRTTSIVSASKRLTVHSDCARTGFA